MWLRLCICGCVFVIVFGICDRGCVVVFVFVFVVVSVVVYCVFIDLFLIVYCVFVVILCGCILGIEVRYYDWELQIEAVEVYCDLAFIIAIR